jgi:hypothetical protein
MIKLMTLLKYIFYGTGTAFADAQDIQEMSHDSTRRSILFVFQSGSCRAPARNPDSSFEPRRVQPSASDPGV